MNLKDSLFVTGYNWGTDGKGGGWEPYLAFGGARFYGVIGPDGQVAPQSW